MGAVSFLKSGRDAKRPKLTATASGWRSHRYCGGNLKPRLSLYEYIRRQQEAGHAKHSQQEGLPVRRDFDLLRTCLRHQRFAQCAHLQYAAHGVRWRLLIECGKRSLSLIGRQIPHPLVVAHR